MRPDERLEAVLERGEPYPFVSIVMPHYRVPEGWANEAVRSALEQNYPRERLEVIVVDDSSGDVSHLKRIPGIRLVELEKNSGPSIARNAGVSAAEGKYVFFADADDRIHPRSGQGVRSRC
jgi:glycosyltransferase involved in cell wall biosynthesis